MVVLGAAMGVVAGERGAGAGWGGAAGGGEGAAAGRCEGEELSFDVDGMFQGRLQ